MDNSRISPKAKAKANPKPRQEDTPEQKAYKKAISDKQVTMRKCKASYEKLRKEANAVGALNPTIDAKGYPASFKEHLKGKVDMEGEKAEAVAQFYAALVIKAEPPTEKEARDVIAEIEAKISATDQALDAAKKGCFLDVRRLCGPGKTGWEMVEN